MEETATVTDVGFSTTSISANIAVRKLVKFAGFLFAALILFVGICFFILIQRGKALFSQTQAVLNDIESGNLEAVKSEIVGVRQAYNSLSSVYSLVSWTKVLPFMGEYTKDAGRVIGAMGAGISGGERLMGSIDPYIGILARPSTGEELLSQKRILFLTSALPAASSAVDGILPDLISAEKNLAEINSSRYPKRYREKLEAFVQGFAYLESSVGILKSLPYFLGLNSPRNFLVLFQNDKEIRPTGGFMTAYSIMKVDQLKFSPVSSEDIYSLDAIYKPSVPAPEPLVKYIKGPYVLSPNWRLRDMNWSPDFGSSMINFTTAANEAGIGNIDGVIAVDTYTLVNILQVLGSVGVPGFGTYGTGINPECKCPQVIHELESFADVEGPIVWDPVSGEIVYKPKNADNRKKIIGPLMNSIVAGMLAVPKEKIPLLFSATFKSLTEKHILFYIFSDSVQKSISGFGIDGKIKDYDGDYLHINDANLGGRKSNLYVTQEVSQEIERDDGGSIVKTITLTYKNPEKHDGWLNSVLPDWVRVYVPRGSELIAVEGLEERIEPYEDLGKTVFAGFFQIRPEGISKVTFKYRLPMKMQGEYKLYIQKQPGTDAPLYTLKFGNREQEFPLRTDKVIKLKI